MKKYVLNISGRVGYYEIDIWDFDTMESVYKHSYMWYTLKEVRHKATQWLQNNTDSRRFYYVNDYR